MKIAIYTQYMENYGTAEQPYWKMKGGSTYVVENVTPEQCRKAFESGFPVLRDLIEYDNSGSREYVVDINVLEDDKVVGEAYETLTKLAYVDGRWVATEVEENGEYGYMRREIMRKYATWVMLPKSERTEYECKYELVDGRVVASDDLADALGV